MDKWLSHPNALRVISVLLALIMWAIVNLDPQTSPQTVTSNTDTKVIEAVPIVPNGLNQDKFVLTAMEPTVARIVVEGRISSLLAATNDEYIVNLDLSNVSPGIQELPLSFELPNGVNLVELSPRVVTVQIEELETQTVEVQIRTQGEPEAGYLVGESRFVSEIGNVVEITMPKDDFSRLDQVAVTVDVTDANDTVTNKKAKVFAYDSQGNIIDNVTFNPETLSVETEIVLPSKDVPLQLRYTGTLPGDNSVIAISTEVRTVKVFAKQEQLDQIDIYDGAVIDLSKVTKSGEVTVLLDKIEGISSVTPTEIPVNVNIEPSTTRTINNVPINIIGLKDGLDLKIEQAVDKTINVRLKGANANLQKIRVSDLNISLDVTNLEIGTHSLTLFAELPAYIQTDISEEFTLDVTVEIFDPATIEAEATSELENIEDSLVETGESWNSQDTPSD